MRTDEWTFVGRVYVIASTFSSSHSIFFLPHLSSWSASQYKFAICLCNKIWSLIDYDRSTLKEIRESTDLNILITIVRRLRSDDNAERCVRHAGVSYGTHEETFSLELVEGHSKQSHQQRHVTSPRTIDGASPRSIRKIRETQLVIPVSDIFSCTTGIDTRRDAIEMVRSSLRSAGRIFNSNDQNSSIQITGPRGSRGIASPRYTCPGVTARERSPYSNAQYTHEEPIEEWKKRKEKGNGSLRGRSIAITWRGRPGSVAPIR